MLSSISRCRFALSFGAFPGILYKKHCKRKKRLRIVVIHYRHFKTDSMGPTHECKSLGRLVLYLVCEDQQRVLRKGLVTWGINNRHISDATPQRRCLQYLKDCWVASYTEGLNNYIWAPVMQGIRLQ